MFTVFLPVLWGFRVSTTLRFMFFWGFRAEGELWGVVRVQGVALQV